MRNTPPPNYTFVQSPLCFAVSDLLQPTYSAASLYSAAAVVGWMELAIQKKVLQQLESHALHRPRVEPQLDFELAGLGHVVESRVRKLQIVLAQFKAHYPRLAWL